MKMEDYKERDGNGQKATVLGFGSLSGFREVGLWAQIKHWQSRAGRVTNTVRFHEKAGHLTSGFIMSQHRSLRAIATVGGKRNVLKRFERVGLLKKRGQWKDGDRITGLRKTKPDA
ncbi:MAG: hypothetical protein JWR19_1061 [Pedosphaera sp.]|nr:hypothetical protein [Pedosphaera sp.]